MMLDATIGADRSANGRPGQVATSGSQTNYLNTIVESGFADRLTQVGGTSTGTTAEATLAIENGLVAAIDADFSDWWSEASRQLLKDGGLTTYSC